MKNPFISIVIPSYNKASYLIEMLKTIKVQTYNNWELIIIDDGSDEDEFEKVMCFITDDDRIRLMRRNRPPKNGNTCRNIGMDMAKGEYILIFDADDLLSETCIENRVRFMVSHPEYDYASFPYASFVEGTNDYRNKPFDMSVTNILERIVSADYPFTVWANIYKRKALESIRWDERLFVYQDFDFMLQCELNGLRHGWADVLEPDYFYRVFVKGESVCSNLVTRQKTVSTNYLFEKTFRRLLQCKDGVHLNSLFLKFVILYYERLLRDNCREYIEVFLSLIDKLYPSEIDNFKIVYNKRRQSNNSHYSLFLMYKSLYHLYKMPIHKTYAIHELAKTLLLRK